MKFMPSMPSGSRFCAEEYLQMPLPNVVTASPAVLVASLKSFGAVAAQSAAVVADASGTRRVFR